MGDRTVGSLIEFQTKVSISYVPDVTGVQDWETSRICFGEISLWIQDNDSIKFSEFLLERDKQTFD